MLEDTVALADRVMLASPARRTAIALAVLLPLASVLTYLQLGDPEAAAPSLAPVTLAIPDKQAALDKVAALRAQIIEGKLKVPSNLQELEAFTPP